MRRTICFCAIVAAVFLTGLSSANADSYYRINLRAYRRMMHHQYPGQLANFVDTRLLQKDGPADQVLNTLLGTLLEQLAGADAADMSVAQNEPTPDQDLKATEERTVAILNKLEVPIPQKVGPAPVPPGSVPPGSDGFETPVTVPPEFTFPRP